MNAQLGIGAAWMRSFAATILLMIAASARADEPSLRFDVPFGLPNALTPKHLKQSDLVVLARARATETVDDESVYPGTRIPAEKLETPVTVIATYKGSPAGTVIVRHYRLTPHIRIVGGPSLVPLQEGKAYFLFLSRKENDRYDLTKKEGALGETGAAFPLETVAQAP